MAAHARQSRDDLTKLATEAGRSDFFQLLRRIEEVDGRRFGRAGGPDKEPARLGQHIRLSFATSDVASMAVDDDKTRVDVNVLGLLGPEGPMPLYLTRWVMTRLSNRWFAGNAGGVTSDTAFVDLANTLQHRMIALYWRAWADARAEVHVSQSGGGPTMAILRSLAGLGLPGTDNPAHDPAKLRHASTLAQRVNSPERLTSYLSDVIDAPVHLEEFIGHWIDIPAAAQTGLGGAYATLGGSAVIGPRTFSRQNKAELRLGPLSLRQFLAFLDDPEKRAALRHAILFAAGHDIAFDVRLVLAAADITPARLGDCRLGTTAWMQPKRGRDADDVVLTQFTGQEVHA
ncbi:type VI secretion system baseplate subunit TssG [Yoonia sediminilitoris]|uniref:Type VI secretion system protein ImpH n=1 Tax=Yoonia sediminilitoris TaxID=1286148 RepID=A0A2T6KM30_9RHOB|nr:type VI secretion system baseplate subunit TssG [Yoonia sediminilitoris]PUB17275.1 type VI secretion system protein ImpH [Yoonia sediminilitoris]RCW97570.1 type VI secretion system protein ImpH [Yoonia sediminilitoris]